MLSKRVLYISKSFSIKVLWNIPLEIASKKKQLQAFNYLDKLLSDEKFYKKTKLNRGDLVVLNNHILAHGRTAFKIQSKKNVRKLYRIWIN